MAGPWTSERFPQFEKAIRRLTKQHRALEDEPLHLALSYQPAERGREDIFLFEVIGGLGKSMNPELDLFEATFATSPGFPMQPHQELHLILTNPQELQIALRDGWSLASELIGAIRSGDYKVLYKDQVGKQLLEDLRADARRPEAARG